MGKSLKIREMRATREAASGPTPTPLQKESRRKDRISAKSINFAWCRREEKPDPGTKGEGSERPEEGEGQEPPTPKAN